MMSVLVVMFSIGVSLLSSTIKVCCSYGLGDSESQVQFAYPVSLDPTFSFKSHFGNWGVNPFSLNRSGIIT